MGKLKEGKKVEEKRRDEKEFERNEVGKTEAHMLYIVNQLSTLETLIGGFLRFCGIKGKGRKEIVKVRKRINGIERVIEALNSTCSHWIDKI